MEFRKKIVVIMCAIVMVLSSVMCVYAEEGVSAEEDINSYYVHSTRVSETDAYITKWQVNTMYSIPKDVKVCLYWGQNGSYYHLYWLVLGSNGVVLGLDTLEGLSPIYNGYLFEKHDIATWYNVEGLYTKHTKESDNSIGGILVESEEYNDTSYCVSGNYWMYQPSFTDTSYCVTNFPIFGDVSTATAYLNGDVSIKEAENYETEISNIAYDLEIPQNLHSEGAVGDEDPNLIFNDIQIPTLNFSWEQTDPNYVDWTTEIYVYETFRYRDATLFVINGDWENVEDYHLYTDSVDTYKLSYGNAFKKMTEYWDYRNKDYPVSTGGDYEPLLETFYFRNSYYDAVEGVRHYSNWVMAEYDWTTDETKVIYTELEGSEIDTDENGKVVKPTGSVVSDSQYNSDYDGHVTRASTDIMGWVQDGFGIAGEGGLIDLISETFSFIPSQLMAVFVAGVAIIVLIAVAKFVF